MIKIHGVNSFIFNFRHNSSNGRFEYASAFMKSKPCFQKLTHNRHRTSISHNFTYTVSKTGN